MRLYPSAPRARLTTVTLDLAVALGLALVLWLALRVHHDVAGLERLGTGVIQTGSSLRQGLNSAANAVSGIPVVGSSLAHGLSNAGAGTGGVVVAAAKAAQTDAGRAATVLGWLTFLLGAGLLLQRYLPARIAQIQRMSAAERVLAANVEENRALLAQRAAFSLPYHQLLRHTRDPLGDLRAGRLQPLLDAILEDAQLRSLGPAEAVQRPR